MSGEIIVLGGLQRTQSLNQANRLGPIPFLGDLFGSSTKSTTRTELVIFMRPYVLNNSAVDNLNAMSRINATPISEEVKKVINQTPAEPFTK
jgi:general secretion pathway protein D